MNRFALLAAVLVLAGCAETTAIGRPDGTYLVKYKNGAVAGPPMQEAALREKVLELCPKGFSRISEAPLSETNVGSGWSWLIRCN